MKIHRWDDIKRKYRTPAELERIEAAAEAEVLEMNLAELRVVPDLQTATIAASGRAGGSPARG